MTTNFKKVLPGDPAHLIAAFELLGLKEIVGGKHEAQVVAFFADAGHDWVKDDETAWCAAFAHSMLGRGGIKGTGSLAARSYLDWGSSTDSPVRGDIVVFKRGNSGWQGHVAFFLAEVGDRVWVLGGNQSNAVSVASYAKSSLLGYRHPPLASVAVPVSAPKPASRALIEAVQKALIAKGYNEVGKPDGLYGSKTRGAILAFEADHALSLTGQPSGDLLEAIMAAEPREVPQDRATGKPENNAALKATNGQLGFGGLLGGGALLGFAEPIVKSIEGGAGLVYRLKSSIEPIVDLWPLGAVVAAGAVIYFALRSRKAVVEDYRTGKLAR
ncbi:TIGR02594 family protein [Devosia ginsengisoli]|uniref:C40 family peptidase n=1 Tax=Devosia ginsengisoli TaxID=400770 RepID=UPI0026EAACCD|nr:TIGR02594 family protein [Devosia ginsengisoli]MCR6673217.1 TIGR02594 family protein [Devosia ginsengisoli]